MRTPAQKAASRANGARSRGPKTQPPNPRTSMDALSLDLLTKTTVLKSESRKGFHEFVHQHMLRFAPRDAVEQDAVEEICSATWRLYRLRAIEREALDLECVLRAYGALAGRNPHVLLQRHETRLQNIIRRALARIEALRRVGPKNIEEIILPDHTLGKPSSAR